MARSTFRTGEAFEDATFSHILQQHLTLRPHQGKDDIKRSMARHLFPTMSFVLRQHTLPPTVSNKTELLRSSNGPVRTSTETHIRVLYGRCSRESAATPFHCKCARRFNRDTVIPTYFNGDGFTSDTSKSSNCFLSSKHSASQKASQIEVNMDSASRTAPSSPP